MFDRRQATRELRRYRQRGPNKVTLAFVEALRREGVAGATVLDIGAGVGGVAHGLIEAGASLATDVDASAAYLDAARSEAARRGHADRMVFHHGNFTELASEIPGADVVTLDRVICCYPDVDALVGLSATRASRLYGLVFPRDIWWTRALMGLLNAGLWLLRNPMRTFVHPDVRIALLVERAGLVRRFHRSFWFWQIALWARDDSK